MLDNLNLNDLLKDAQPMEQTSQYFYYGLVDPENKGWGFVDENDPRVTPDMVKLTEEEWQTLLDEQSEGIGVRDDDAVFPSQHVEGLIDPLYHVRLKIVHNRPFHIRDLCPKLRKSAVKGVIIAYPFRLKKVLEVVVYRLPKYYLIALYPVAAPLLALKGNAPFRKPFLHGLKVGYDRRLAYPEGSCYIIAPDPAALGKQQTAGDVYTALVL